MEFKKKTIIWEDNNEPPKSYIWAKPDGKFYEYNATKGWTESKLIKIDGDAEDDDGGGGNSDVFFSPISIQPSQLFIENEIVDIKNITVDTLYYYGGGDFLYSKESLVSIGVSEEGLDNLEQVSYPDTFDSNNESRGLYQDDLKNIILQNNLIEHIETDDDGFYIAPYIFSNSQDYAVIFKIGDNIYRIAKFSAPS